MSLPLLIKLLATIAVGVLPSPEANVAALALLGGDVVVASSTGRILPSDRKEIKKGETRHLVAALFRADALETVSRLGKLLVLPRYLFPD
jgi:hypothetical protein